MSLIDVDLKDKGYILLTQGMQSCDLTDKYIKYREWAKVNQETSIDYRVVVRLYKSNNQVIIYRGGSVEYFKAPEMLFNGRVDSVELLELIYSLVK